MRLGSLNGGLLRLRSRAPSHIVPMILRERKNANCSLRGPRRKIYSHNCSLPLALLTCIATHAISSRCTFGSAGQVSGRETPPGDGCLSPSILDFMCGGEVSFKYAINAVFTQNPLLTTQVTSWTAETIRTRIIFESFQNKAPWRQIPLNENNEITFVKCPIDSS